MNNVLTNGFFPIFAIMAFAEYAKASGDREALDDLREIAANDSNKKIRERASKSILLIEKRK